MNILYLSVTTVIIGSFFTKTFHSDKEQSLKHYHGLKDSVLLYIDSTYISPHAVCTSVDTAVLYPNEVEYLDLSYKQFNKLPDAISKLTRLRKFSIQDQSNLNWHDTFEKLDKLDSLKVLEIIDCAFNVPPDNFSNLKHLKKLLIQMEKDSGYIEFPLSITNCTSLEELYINNVNNGIPEQIKNLKNLKRIGVGYGFKEFPKQLLLLENIEEIYLNYNDIHELPNEITQLKKLKILCIEDTPLACSEFNYYCKYHKYKKLQYLKDNMPKLNIQLFYSGPEI